MLNKLQQDSGLYRQTTSPPSVAKWHLTLLVLGDFNEEALAAHGILPLKDNTPVVQKKGINFMKSTGI